MVAPKILLRCRSGALLVLVGDSSKSKPIQACAAYWTGVNGEPDQGMLTCQPLQVPGVATRLANTPILWSRLEEAGHLDKSGGVATLHELPEPARTIPNLASSVSKWSSRDTRSLSVPEFSRQR